MSEVKIYDFVGCDKKLVALDDYAALQQKLDALAAHNSALMVLAEACSREYESTSTEDCSDDEKTSYPEESCHITFGMIRNALKNPATDAYLNSVRADAIKDFCQLLGQYGKVEPHHFNPDFADLYANINKEIYESILDNPAVYDMESLVDWLERGADDSRAYANMSSEFAAQLRAGQGDK